MRPDEETDANASWFRRHWKTVLWLVLLLATAAFFRVWFNYEPAINEGTYRYAGNDDYYHLRSVTHIEENGRHLRQDPLLNYPAPAYNPRPPVYNWHVAIAARLLDFVTPMDGAEAAGYALEWGSAFWGILTVLPIWLIGRFLYGNSAGLWAGFLVAASPAHIQRSGFGLGDHDAFLIFFLALGAYFLLRALHLTRDDTRVQSWKSLSSIAEGFGAYVATHREGLAYALLAGVCWTAIALSWEGFPYVTAIYAVYFVFQIFFNHLRRRDSTGDLLVMLAVMVPVTLLPMPYYWIVGNISHTLASNAYLVAGMAVLGLALVPTRDLPSVLVLPLLGLVGLVALAVILLLFPDIGNQLLSANGYFVQSKLYSTIAEAQRTELGVLVFSIGFMTFFLGLVGFVWAAFHYFKSWRRDQLFMVVWGLVSIYMAFAASRFIFNAAPAFTVLAGVMTDRVVRWMNLRERARSFQSLRHDSILKAFRSTVGAKQIAGGLFLGLTLILPNVWFSFDAGFPSEVRANYRQNHPGARDFLDKQTGAFGQGFLGGEWIDTYAWLATQDAVDDQGRPVACDQRPAHMAWWDYGFWEVALGCHPTVADNFQQGVDVAGRFLAAESEKEAVELLAVRLLEGEYIHNLAAGEGKLSEATKGVLAQVNASLPSDLRSGPVGLGYDVAVRMLAENLTDLEAAVDLYLNLSRSTGYYVGYFLTDARMLPLDDPRTPYIESGSIFYAPMFLANKNPDDYVQTVYVAQTGAEYKVVAYRVDEDNVSRQVSPPQIIGPDGRQYIVSGGSIVRATSDGRSIDFTDNQGQGRNLMDPRQGSPIKLKFHEPFYRTMYYRGYVGGDGNPPAGGDNYHPDAPGSGLVHWRLVKDTSSVKLLKFYRGALLEGRITAEDTGEPIPGATVAAFDEYGVPHDQTLTDAEGRYRLRLPFSQADANGTLLPVAARAARGNVEIANATFQVTEAQAMGRTPFQASGDLRVAKGSLDVFAYLDRDRDGSFNESVDAPAAGANVTWPGANGTTGPDGHVRFASVQPGGATVQASLAGYATAADRAEVHPGQAAEVQLGLKPAPVAVNGTVRRDNGTGVLGLAVNITAQEPARDGTQNVATPPLTNADGNFSASLQPGGRYVFRVEAVRTENGTSVRYEGSTELDVPIGSPPLRVEIAVTRTEQGAAP